MNMNKILHWIIGIGIFLVIALVSIGGWFLTRNMVAPIPPSPVTKPTPPPSNSTQPVVATTSPSPQASSTPPTEQTLTLTGQGGEKIVVKDFVNNGQTIKDTVNPGNYYLVGSPGYCLGDGTCPRAGEEVDYNISYNESDQSFTIILSEEPLKSVRERAENELMKFLGIPQTSLCALTYWVVTPYWVNQLYSGKNLGFSFCTGATQVP